MEPSVHAHPHQSLSSGSCLLLLLAAKRTLSMSVRGVALRLAMGRVGSGGIDLNAKAPDALGLGSQSYSLSYEESVCTSTS